MNRTVLIRPWITVALFLSAMLSIIFFIKSDFSTSSIPHVQMRPFPYPYQAMLSFASDIDGTTPEEFAQYHQFLNTKSPTPMGTGLGLDIGDSFWMYMDTNSSNPYYVDNQKHTSNAIMTYFVGTDRTKKKDAALINHYYRAGWIDSMHGYGDFSRVNRNEGLCTRDLAMAAWDHLNQDGIHPDIWINHGNEANRENFGAYSPFSFTAYQQGDNKYSPYYHTDLIRKNGVHFVWNSRGDAAFGEKNAIFPIRLRDGQNIWGFHRYAFDRTKHGVNWTWGPRALYMQLTSKRLDELVARHEYSIIAQHFGGGNGLDPFDNKNIQPLRMLAYYQASGRILVARTSRLLHYNVAHNFLDYSVTTTPEGKTKIQLYSIKDPLFGSRPVTINDVRGITFYVADPHNVELFIGEHELDPKDVQHNPPDQTGKRSISIKWFAPDTFDYTKTAPRA
ncbi:hypothetical protein [Aneurinibacillus uraniidurans]|uniref:hypothetical protein n=1 Tax=Aneurinibacillus uraniidurans TaxID=2966586 RepID=UPI00234A86CE|nr:hypothetical protein [Aneurinibacillus sp. B1]WCN38636.1 hypothetical protein PO771_04325 [Aneurinibacillus sp. B1]